MRRAYVRRLGRTLIVIGGQGVGAENVGREEQNTCNAIVPAPLGMEPNISHITRPDNRKWPLSYGATSV